MALKVKQDDFKFPLTELEAFETKILQKTCDQIMTKLSRLDPKDVLKNSLATDSVLQVTLSGYKVEPKEVTKYLVNPVTGLKGVMLTSSELVKLIKTKNAEILANKIPSYVNELITQLKTRLFLKDKDQDIIPALLETAIVPTEFWATPSGLAVLKRVVPKMSVEQRKTFAKNIDQDSETGKTLKNRLPKLFPETAEESEEVFLKRQYQGSLPFSKLAPPISGQSHLKYFLAASSANPLKVGIQSERDLAYFEDLWFHAVTEPQSGEADILHLIEKGIVKVTNVNEKLITSAINNVSLPYTISIDDILPPEYEPKFENGQISLIPFPKKAPRKKVFTMDRPIETLFDAPSIKKGQRVILTPDYTLNRKPDRNWSTKDSDLICKFIEKYNDPKQISDGVYGTTHPKKRFNFPQDIRVITLQQIFNTTNLSLDPQMSIDKESFYLHQKWPETEDTRDYWRDTYLKEEVEGPYLEEAKAHLPSFIEKCVEKALGHKLTPKKTNSESFEISH